MIELIQSFLKDELEQDRFLFFKVDQIPVYLSMFRQGLSIPIQIKCKGFTIPPCININIITNK